MVRRPLQRCSGAVELRAPRESSDCAVANPDAGAAHPGTDDPLGASTNPVGQNLRLPASPVVHA